VAILLEKEGFFTPLWPFITFLKKQVGFELMGPRFDIIKKGNKELCPQISLTKAITIKPKNC